MSSPAEPYRIALKTLRLREPFRIAHGATSERLVVRVRHGEAIGEAPFVPYYNESPESTLEWLRGVDPRSGLPDDGPKAGRLALSILEGDMAGRAKGEPLWMMWGLNPANCPPACRSLGIPDDLDEFRKKVRSIAGQFPVVKLKLGGGNLDFDEAIVAAAREAAPEVRLFADANCGWSPADAARIIPRLVRWRLEFIEQPVGRESLDGWRELRRLLPNCPLPLVADESAQSAGDVARLAGLADGVNVKLVKCGGLDRAREMIATARAHRMQVLLGCMIESSIGITAAAHFAPLADLVDLDGHLYLTNDDFVGATYDAGGQLVLPTTPGLGCRERQAPRVS
jgi:L-Ala-D/L-Glu epimerase / N-acetyl-D-glutamate racemase